MNRRHFLSWSALVATGLSLPKLVAAAPPGVALDAQAPGARTPATKTPPIKGEILFAEGRSLFFQNPYGSPPREVKLALPETTDPARGLIEMVSLSDDGQRVAFRADGVIYRANADGTGLTVLAEREGSEISNPSLSADGKWVACGHDKIHHPLTILSETGAKRNLGDTTLETYFVRFARDGKTLFFNASSHLKTIAIEDGEATTILRGHYIEAFDVGPAGRLIAAIPSGNTAMSLGIVGEDGTVENLTPKEDDYHAPTWSPDGKYIAFSKRPRYGSGAANGIYILTLEDYSIRQISDRAFNPTSGLMWR